MREIHGTDEYRGARFTAVDLAGAEFRDVDLSGAKFVDAMLVNASLSGMIDGLTVNDIEVGPLIVAEMDRRWPERKRMLATDPEGLQSGWSQVEEMWRATVDRATALPDELRHARVDGEWSFVETLRHLVFVTDGWISRVVLGAARPYHPLALPPSFVTDLGDVGIDSAAQPTFDEVVEARRERMSIVRELVDRVTPEELERVCAQNPNPGYPPETTHTVLAAIHVTIDEEWAHHRYAARDLDTLTAAP